MSENQAAPALISDKPKPNWLLISLSILALLLVATTGLLFYQNQQLKKQIQQIETSAKKKQGSYSPPKPTAGWRIYTTADASFSIKYPKDWYFEENPDFQKPQLVEDALEVKVQFANFKPPFKGLAGSIPEGCRFDILVAETDLSLDEFISKNPNIGSTKGAPSYTEKIIVDGKTAEKRIYSSEKIHLETKVTIYVASQGKVVVLYSFSQIADQAIACSEIIESMLSTFKFLDQEETDETANWKTYTNTNYNYSVKYPSDWMIGTEFTEGAVFQNFTEPKEPYGGFAGGDDGIMIGFSAKGSPGNLSLEQFVEQESQDRIIDEKTKTLMSGLETIKVTYAEEIGAGIPTIYFKRDQYFFLVNVGYGSKAENQAFDTLDQILSTFNLD